MALACDFEGSDAPDTPRARLLAAPAGEPNAPEATRAAARQAARAALAAAIARELGCAPGALVISDRRGAPPRATLAASAPADAGLAARLAAMGLSIGHAPGLSLIAWHTGGAVGVDVQAVPRAAPVPDLLRTAALYLGPDTATTLARQAQDASIFEAFTRAWTLHEARLKCAGQPLVEWTPALGQALATLHAVPLHLPPWAAPKYAAALAWPPH